MRHFLFETSSESTSACFHVTLGSFDIDRLLEQRQKFLDVKETVPGLEFFDVSNFDAAVYMDEGVSKLEERLNDDERKTFDNGPWVELAPERAELIFKDIKLGRTAADYAHINGLGVFWSCQDKFSDERYETNMIPWKEFGVNRAARALAIVEQLAEDFAKAERECMEEGGEGINGGDLVDWVAGRLAFDGFLAEAEAKLGSVANDQVHDINFTALQQTCDSARAKGTPDIRSLLDEAKAKGAWEISFPTPFKSDPMSYEAALQLVREKFGADVEGRVCLLKTNYWTK